MPTESRPLVASSKNRPREGWDDPTRGEASWFTFFSADRTPTNAMSAGLMELEPGGALMPHRHSQPEIYFIAEGQATLIVDGAETRLEAGSAAFIPSDAEHGLRNTGVTVLKVFYVFPTDRFSEVIYRFGEPSPARN